ncbi:unnamed protein product [Symbiodinium pilosum]|uniref:Uncharacterized protein n=1 Tax=Symbiodinium pilosum TaxID=2952 RepID=A0A812QQF3_SYMPI|nr:unnamed protein product [Symbiodinium pilosum]
MPATEGHEQDRESEHLLDQLIELGNGLLAQENFEDAMVAFHQVLAAMKPEASEGLGKEETYQRVSCKPVKPSTSTVCARLCPRDCHTSECRSMKLHPLSQQIKGVRCWPCLGFAWHTLEAESWSSVLQLQGLPSGCPRPRHGRPSTLEELYSLRTKT